ncbi:uncharacterized protein C8Q71DRAFT_286626 [Rhodofomes roseus]|uniref:Uncharacterized protein n=1 Tax=Rhodofomes roseus TaxID=34475 RepID=A0ABQ8K4I3_9APHY|nr:uncharacterized protein C8Q71DRAFT_286626 [Rhodofomes roseus]KAH9831821.1 hypothetical protein C8Q71DRAFT_286626 [Rhodofomes roseus]
MRRPILSAVRSYAEAPQCRPYAVPPLACAIGLQKLCYLHIVSSLSTTTSIYSTFLLLFWPIDGTQLRRCRLRVALQCLDHQRMSGQCARPRGGTEPGRCHPRRALPRAIRHANARFRAPHPWMSLTAHRGSATPGTALSRATRGSHTMPSTVTVVHQSTRVYARYRSLDGRY